MTSPSQHPPSLETVDTYLERARQTDTPVRLVLGGRYEEPVLARVMARNGPTFEFAVVEAGEVRALLRMELGAVIVRTD
ncbi:MAG: hypothetical protein KC593_07595 [Myxococcales bacterium]|nr:hypothetical protein [Myxococcales bacterium]